MSNVIQDVVQEMQRQVDRWGVQNHLSYTDGDAIGDIVDVRMYHPPAADFAKDVYERKALVGLQSWNDILLEEVMEARDEAYVGDLAKLREELIQVAAVACSWVESIDRNQH